MTTENYRHVFLYYKNRVSWPPRFDSSDADPLPKLFISTWKSDMDDMTIKAKIYVCEVNEDPTRYYTKTRGDFSDGDVLIFPDMIKYRGLVESNVESFFEDVLVNSKPWSAGVPEVLTGSYIYVFALPKLDVRTDDTVSFYIQKFNIAIKRSRPDNDIYITACCHVDGYEGRAIIFSQGPDGKTAGHWCFSVPPHEVADKVTQHIKKIEPTREQIKRSFANVKRVDHEKLANGESTNKGKNRVKTKRDEEDNHPDIRTAVGVIVVAAAAITGAHIFLKGDNDSRL
ncbi:hypothetical protein OROGR_027264 [Orobanche gracilis]